ncbi:hypothetical protein GCK32_005537 [Trichostrongylus colubriformis]|uniref:Uncharacterized protein n=1 Tax=Trichostrongylus colubriformis TaxID=6319 RepID=A0AAN8IPR0_TRICO
MNMSLLVLILIANFLVTTCQRQHAPGFLGMTKEEEEEVIGSSHESFMDRPRFSDKGEYCAMYRTHYEYFCHGIWTVEKLISHQNHFSRIKQFCPTYTHNCITPIIQKPKRKHRRHRHRHHPRTIRSSSYGTEILDELAVPCTPECDSRMYPHCTQECKCDHDYPTMQRFCNPPALPLFLNTCRNAEFASAQAERPPRSPFFEARYLSYTQ